MKTSGSGRKLAAGPDFRAELNETQNLAWLLDARWRVPFTRIRFGVDPLLGLIPGAGDVVAGVVSAYVILKARRLGAPRSLILRMVANVAIDTVVGSVPVVGVLFDIYYKASMRNLRLLHAWLEERGKI
jgi:hypothetical protein